MALIWNSLCVSSCRSSSGDTHTHTHRVQHADLVRPTSAALSGLTGLLIGPAALLAQATQPLQQPGVLGLQLLYQTLGGTFVDHGSVLDALGPVGGHSSRLNW